jgi:hypothetical protein
MNKSIYALFVLVMLTLSACAGQAPVAHNASVTSANPLISLNKSASTSANGDTLTTDFDNAEPVISQLILGLLKLDGTDLTLSKDQGASLITLWDQYQTAVKELMPIGGKQTGTPAALPTPDPQASPAAPVENTKLTAKLDAIVTSMQAVLTDRQIAAIKEMKITRDIATTIMKEMNITNGRPDLQNGQSGQQGNQPPAGGQQGQQGNQQGGQPPAGGQSGQSGQQGSQPPADGKQRGNGMVQPGLLKAFTVYLEKVSGTKSTVAFEPAGFSPAGVLSGG